MKVHTICQQEVSQYRLHSLGCRAESFETLYGHQTQGKLEEGKSSNQKRSLREYHEDVHLQRTGKLHRSSPSCLSHYKRKLKADK